MRVTPFIAAGLGLAIAGSAAASERLTDAEYIKANRCRALAASDALGPMDTSAVDAFLKDARRTRASAVLTMAEEAQARATRDARSADKRARLQSELAGACTAYLNPGTETAKRSGAETAQP